MRGILKPFLFLLCLLLSPLTVYGEPIVKYAQDDDDGPQRNFGVQSVHDNQIFATLMADRFEHQWQEEGVEALLWDVQGWVGNDYHKIYIESEGEYLLDNEELEEAEVELLYTYTLSTFWDLQCGVRHDFRPKPSRSFAAFGVQGLAPQWFEVDATAYLSEDGDLSIDVEAEYEVLLTQRLRLVPRFETTVSAQDVPEYETWQGIGEIVLGARLQYQVRRKFAPYLGVSWNRKVGETGHVIDKRGGETSSVAFVAGIRFWL